MKKQTRRFIELLCVLVLAADGLLASKVGVNPPAQSLTMERVAGFSLKERADWQRYVERSVRARARDKAAFADELKHAAAMNPSDPPHGYNAHSLPLDHPDSWYGSPQAQQLSVNVVSFQTPSGGWGKNLDFSQRTRQRGERYVPNNLSRLLGVDDYDKPLEPEWNYVGTIDNDATTTELRFLARVVHQSVLNAQSKKWRAAFARGLDYLLAAQAPNGGWPQVWPLEGGYHDAITFNDDAMTQVILFLHEVSGGTGEYSFASASQRRRASIALSKGLACTLRLQIQEGGQGAGWAQQYDMLTLRPTSARNYEIPALSTAESAGIVEMLMTCLPHPNHEQRQAIRAAVMWLQRTAIHGKAYVHTPEGRALVDLPSAGLLWPRYVEIGSDKPLFGDRDKTIYDRLNDLSLERRNGYAWFEGSPQRALDAFARWSKESLESR